MTRKVPLLLDVDGVLFICKPPPCCDYYARLAAIGVTREFALRIRSALAERGVVVPEPPAAPGLPFPL